MVVLWGVILKQTMYRLMIGDCRSYRGRVKLFKKESAEVVLGYLKIGKYR